MTHLLGPGDKYGRMSTLCGIVIAEKVHIEHPINGTLGCDACKAVVVALLAAPICPFCGSPMGDSTKDFWICLGDACFALFCIAETDDNLVVLPL